jgi:pSer/pThr/pTyr-binding forkhead associated (FHA) protein
MLALEEAMGSLFVMSGPDKGELFRIDGGEIIVGRDPECSFQLTDAGVSRRHFRIAPDPSAPADATRPLLIDLGSANGTLLNGVKVMSPTPLSDNDVITVGGTSLRFAARALSEAAPFAMQHIPRPSERHRKTLTPNQPLPKPPRGS